MTIDTISQLWITVFGATALWMMNGNSARHRRIGVLCGLASQPAWYTQLVVHDQWLMLPVYSLYTAAWLRGMWSHWIAKAGATKL